MEAFNETALDHLGGSNYWGVSTGEMKWKNRLAKLRAEHPDEVKLIAENKDGSVFYHVPNKWVKISPPKKSNMTEEQKDAVRERFAAARQAKAESEDDEE